MQEKKHFLYFTKNFSFSIFAKMHPLVSLNARSFHLDEGIDFFCWSCMFPIFKEKKEDKHVSTSLLCRPKPIRTISGVFGIN